MQNPQNGSNEDSSKDVVPLAMVTEQAVFAEIATGDPAEFEIALRPWELICRPATRGSFRHRVLMLQTPYFIVYREKYSLPLHIQGLTPRNMLGFGIPSGAGRQAQFWGLSHEAETIPATLPGSLDASIAAGHAQTIIFVDLDCLQTVISEPLFETLRIHAQQHRFRLPVNRISTIDTWAHRVLLRWKQNRDRPGSGIFLRYVFRQLLDHMVDIAHELTPLENVSGRSARDIGMGRALEYLREITDENISLPELCRIAGISERSLQYAFREAFDLTPMQFMVLRRLHFVRQKLLTIPDPKSVVTRTAIEYGFTELGRFARNYKDVFGELPSETAAILYPGPGARPAGNPET